MAKKRRYFRVDWEVMDGDIDYVVASSKKSAEKIVSHDHPEAEAVDAVEVTKKEYKESQAH